MPCRANDRPIASAERMSACAKIIGALHLLLGNLVLTNPHRSLSTDNYYPPSEISNRVVYFPTIPSLPNLISQFLINQQGLDIVIGEYGLRTACLWAHFNLRNWAIYEDIGCTWLMSALPESGHSDCQELAEIKVRFRPEADINRA